ncbi:MAG: ABC transporter permease [Bacteroidia bacterium]|nr:ABC transporter permease [Bacteroidia bacterium]HRG02692.1 ABC transporter permease [Paludibacteraceae bacterium]
MSKIGIIIQREYTSRVMKKSFLLLTFLTPVFMAAMIVLPMWISSMKDDTIKTIVVIDKSKTLHQVLKSNEQYTFIFTDEPVDEYRKKQADGKSRKTSDLTALLYVSDDPVKNPNAVTIYSEKQINVELKTYLNNELNNYVRDSKLASYNIPDLKKKIESSKGNVTISTIKWDEAGNEKQGSAEMALIIGMLAAFMIYMFIMTYGSQVMSGVLQEKTSRIVEVIVSSVKPFELMMGKIIGIALVGLTQFTIWIVFTLILSSIGTALFGPELSTSAMPDTLQMGQSVTTDASSSEMISEVMAMLSGFDFVKVVVLFIIYFLGGYLLYASLFAAIGSAVDNETDTQQFSMPVTLPIIFSIFIGIYAAQSPDSALAFWGSVIPFTSPVVMMARIPYDVPAWQVLVSLALLIGSFIGSTWIAGKIYRTGILMYGKKVSWSEIWKWIRVK